MPMTNGELIRLLSQFPADRPVKICLVVSETSDCDMEDESLLSIDCIRDNARWTEIVWSPLLRAPLALEESHPSLAQRLDETPLEYWTRLAAIERFLREKTILPPGERSRLENVYKEHATIEAASESFLIEVHAALVQYLPTEDVSFTFDLLCAEMNFCCPPVYRVQEIAQRILSQESTKGGQG